MLQIVLSQQVLAVVVAVRGSHDGVDVVAECARPIMKSTPTHSWLTALVLVALLGITSLAQQPAPWKPPLTPGGHPDLQGVWVNNTITPFERPAELAGREFLTPAEVETLKKRAARLFSGSGDAVPAQVSRTQPRIISGGDLGFRVTGTDTQGRPVGSIVVRVNGEWVETGEPMGPKRLTAGQ